MVRLHERVEVCLFRKRRVKERIGWVGKGVLARE